jgi:hypothetical protein
MPEKAIPRQVSLTRRQRKILEAYTRQRKTPQWLARRAAMILHWSQGRGVTDSARTLSVDRAIIYIWRKRWWHSVSEWEGKQTKWSHKILREKVRDVLSDLPRSGAPTKFEPEEVCRIIALACKKPDDVGFPVSHWSASDLTKAVLQEKIVESISVRTVGRILKRGTSSPIGSAIG